MLEGLNVQEVSELIQRAGIAGAGGAGFPTFSKWNHLDRVQNLMVNHQESEPDFYSDKWLMKNHADLFAKLFEGLLSRFLDLIVVSSKEKYRDKWMKEIEEATDGTVILPEQLPIDVNEQDGIVFAYTEDVYDFSQEPSLLWITSKTQIGTDLPMEHGWIVNNTETLFNIYHALKEKRPVMSKFVHVDGETPRHRCLKSPVGSPVDRLLEAAGVKPPYMEEDQVLLDGGPGWCSQIQEELNFGVRKRTNGLLVLDKSFAEEHRDPHEEERFNLLEAKDWKNREHERVPHDLTPETVKVPLITNPAYEGLVEYSVPDVSEGDAVEKGERIASPAPEGISNFQHAPLSGQVQAVNETRIEIRCS